MLNFEAVDYRCRVSVNGREVGRHVGGNLPFTFDVTDAIQSGRNELILRVEDSTDGAQLRGKQHLRPHGIWYTRVSGIWQTVWLEEVAGSFLQDLDVVAELPSGTVQFMAKTSGTSIDGARVRYSVTNGPTLTVDAASPAAMTISAPSPWSPDSPTLYEFKAELLAANGSVLDSVDSYFAFRTVGKEKDRDGHWRLTLNGKPIFHLGPLDQGWWPDGLLTPPSDEALAFDIRFLKSAGFNMIRKHIKVEPRRFYHHCDRLGMMVWQDQPSALINPPWTRLAPNPEDAEWSDPDHQQYMTELDGMITHLEDVPSIVMWVPFNEAWGQHRTMEVGEWTAARDRTRLVNVASGGNFWPVGDIADEHSYPHPAFPFDQPRFNDYVKVVGEFGGHGWPVSGHLWANSDRNWGYGNLPKTIDEYKARYRESMQILASLKSRGIAAGVYTQTTDVEGEINGLMTYDRKVLKIDPQELQEMHEPLLAE
jgi:beta-galactosidase